MLDVDGVCELITRAPAANRLTFTVTGLEAHAGICPERGLSAIQIASDICLSVPTVRTHIRSILMKLGVNTQLQAVAMVHGEMWSLEQRREAFNRAIQTQPAPDLTRRALTVLVSQRVRRRSNLQVLALSAAMSSS